MLRDHVRPLPLPAFTIPGSLKRFRAPTLSLHGNISQYFDFYSIINIFKPQSLHKTSSVSTCCQPSTAIRTGSQLYKLYQINVVRTLCLNTPSLYGLEAAIKKAVESGEKGFM
jgi:hypothetical protein